MGKIYGAATHITSIHEKLMKKITGSQPCEAGERIVHIWKFGNKPAHAGQIYGQKVLPNGNIQRRITTAYAGDANTIATDTRVYSPKGELLKAYYGVRGAKVSVQRANGEIEKLTDETRTFATGKDVPAAIRNARTINPEMKSIQDFIK